MSDTHYSPDYSHKNHNYNTSHSLTNDPSPNLDPNTINNNNNNDIIFKPDPPFSYLQRKTNKPQLMHFSFQSFFNYTSLQYYLKICILIPDDSYHSSQGLRETISNLFQNISGLQEVGINERNILLCLFIPSITQPETALNIFDTPMPKLLKETSMDYKVSLMQCVSEINYPIDIVMCYKHNCLPVEALTCFYYGFVRELNTSVKRKEIHYMMIIQNGALFNEKKIRNLIIATHSNSGMNTANCRTIASVPSVEYIIPRDTHTTLYAKVRYYEQVHYNIYDLQYYSMACSVPIDSRFCLLKVSSEIYDNLSRFYEEIPYDASLYYHDYKLAVFIKQIGMEVSYVPSMQVYIRNETISFDELMQDYSNKNQGIIGISGDLILFLFNCTSCYGKNALNHFFIIFLLIGMITDFVLPSLMTEVMYTIFNEAFGLWDYRPSAFFAILYMIIVILTGMYSLVNPQVKQFKWGYFALYVFYMIYYIFVLICAVVAMDNINKNKTNDSYAFNTGALVALIILNVIIGIIPIALNCNKILQNIIFMIIYFFFGSVNYSSLFLIHSIFNASDAKGSLITFGNNRKAYVILGFIFGNAFFGYLIFVMVDRTSRVNCVLALAITFTLYNFVKMIAIAIGRKCFSKTMKNEIECENILKRIREEKENEVKNMRLQGGDDGNSNGNRDDVLESEENLNKNDIVKEIITERSHKEEDIVIKIDDNQDSDADSPNREPIPNDTDNFDNNEENYSDFKNVSIK